MTHAQWQFLIVLLGLAAIAEVANLRELSIGIILLSALYCWILKHVHIRAFRRLADQLEGSYNEPKPNLAGIVRQSMDWKAQGKEYYAESEDVLFVGHKVSRIVGKGSEFVPQIRVDAQGFHELSQLP